MIGNGFWQRPLHRNSNDQ